MKQNSYPTKVVQEIESGTYSTKIFDNYGKLIGKMVTLRTSEGFSRKTHSMDKRYPDFLSEVDGFHLSDIADQLRDFADGVHPDYDLEDACSKLQQLKRRTNRH